jgi:hypothetical protein
MFAVYLIIRKNKKFPVAINFYNLEFSAHLQKQVENHVIGEMNSYDLRRKSSLEEAADVHRV